jgi:formate-dependent phosphoribosylglycinamide formyltransferase (GAR transformylase)
MPSLAGGRPVHVVFVEPRFPANQRRFVRALKEVGAGVTGIGEAPREALGDDLQGWLDGYEQVGSVCDEAAMTAAVRRVQARGWVDRLEATVEAHVLPAARVREACGIPGTSVRTAFLCRDKPAMKEALRAAGVPTARSVGASSSRQVREFAAEVGFPLVVKPRGSAGAAGTVRVDDSAGLERAIAEAGLDRGGSVAVEEFVEGHEGFYDTLSVDGRAAHEFVSHYYPGVLEAMRTRWISPQIVATNRVDAPGYEEVKALGAAVASALGIGTAATHMEWFFGPKGLRFSEIGCRPPGVGVWDLHGAGNDMDLYREWALAIAFGRVEATPSRRFSAGMIALRPDQDGRIVVYEGLDEVARRMGTWILDAHLPPPGTPTQPVEAGYMANAWIRARHPDYDELRRMLDFVGETVRVRAA